MECLIFVRWMDIYTLGCVRRERSDSSAPELLHWPRFCANRCADLMKLQFCALLPLYQHKIWFLCAIN